MKQNNPIEEDIKTYSSLEAVKNSEGGKLILESLKKDIITGIDILSSKYKTATHIELLGTIASITEKLSLYRSISRSTKNKNLALEALLEEENAL